MILCTLIVLFWLTPKSQAYSNDIDTISKEYTSSDFYEYHNEIYDIKDYVNIWNDFYMGREPGYGQRNISMGSSYRFDNNDIVNIIPEDLFFAVGIYHYIGVEYGFYINTELVNNGNNYRSYVVVYDIDYKNPDFFSHNSSLKIEMLFNCWYEGYVRTPNNIYSNLIVDGKDRVVTFLTTAYQSGSQIYMKNISVSVALENRDNLNPGDLGYEIMNYDTLELIDKGDFITSQVIEIMPKEMPSLDSSYELSWKEQIVNFAFREIIKSTKILSPLLIVESLIKDNVNIDNINHKYTAIQPYGTGYDQLLLSEKFVRVSSVNSNSDYIEYNPLFNINNYLIVTTNIDGTSNPQDRTVMGLSYGISVTIDDPRNPNNEFATASTINEFNYTRYMKVANINSVHSSMLDSQLS